MASTTTSKTLPKAFITINSKKIQWNLFNLTHQGTREMCRIVHNIGILRFISVNRNTLGPYIFVGCHRMSENSGVGLHKFHCNYKMYIQINEVFFVLRKDG